MKFCLRREYFLSRTGRHAHCCSVSAFFQQRCAASVRGGMCWYPCTGLTRDTSKLELVFKSVKVSGSACLSLQCDSEMSSISSSRDRLGCNHNSGQQNTTVSAKRDGLRQQDRKRRFSPGEGWSSSEQVARDLRRCYKKNGHAAHEEQMAQEQWEADHAPLC